MLRVGEVVVILAGGAGSRVGALSSMLPKAFLPVSTVDTILTRLLSQLCETHAGRVVVSTGPHRAELFRAFLKLAVPQITERSKVRTVSVEVLENPAHRFGPLPALAHVLSMQLADRYVVCLSDIVYARNPFSEAIEFSGSSSTSLIVGPYQTGRGGVAVSRQGKLRQLQYRFEPSLVEPSDLHNWSGAAEFGSQTASELVEFCRTATDKPLEEAFTFLLNQGRDLSVRNGGDFVNVNSLADWRAVSEFIQ